MPDFGAPFEDTPLSVKRAKTMQVRLSLQTIAPNYQLNVIIILFNCGKLYYITQ